MLSRRIASPLLGLGAFLVAAGCKVKDPPPITSAWQDTFERIEIGGAWYASGAGYQISGGALSAKGAHNHPLWLRKKLPRDVRIELDAWSTENRGDIKVELFGDGRSFDPDGGAYQATGYVLIFGGWYNARSIIARRDEHGQDSVERREPKVQPNHRYHWKVERRGTVLTWWVDDMATPFLVYDDPDALAGPGHDYFCIDNWETDTWFDNLVISPLDDPPAGAAKPQPARPPAAPVALPPPGETPTSP